MSIGTPLLFLFLFPTTNLNDDLKTSSPQLLTKFLSACYRLLWLRRYNETGLNNSSSVASEIQLARSLVYFLMYDERICESNTLVCISVFAFEVIRKHI